jgi:hypothetical protein
MRDRSKLISIEISDMAKKIYDQQPHKGEFVSEAIIEKHNKGAVVTRQEFEELEKKVNSIINRMGGEGV